jgi:hypothetical protein
VLAASLLAVSACASDRQLPAPPDDASAVLVGSVGPGSPPDGDLPDDLELHFSSPGEAARTTVARDGQYEVVLPRGTWEVRAADGRACATGLVLQGGSSQRMDLVYPSGECLSVSPPDGPAAPPPPPG